MLSTLKKTFSAPREPVTDQLLRIATPILVLALTISAACFVVSFRLPLKLAAPYIAISAIILLTYSGFRIWRRAELEIFILLALVTVVFCIVRLLVAAPGCSFQNIVSPYFDPWSYSAFSKYLWENARGADSNLRLIDQYASQFSTTRFATPSLLGILSLAVRPGDPASAISLFFVVCSVCFSLSVYCLSIALTLPRHVAIAAATLAAGTGWIANITIVGNLDQLLFLPLLTLTAAIMISVIVSNSEFSIGRLLAFIISCSASIYTYPEGLAIGLAVILPITVLFLYRSYSLWGKKLFGAIVAIVLLTAPYLAVFYKFLLYQIEMAKRALRPGEGAFDGLLHPMRLIPGAFAFGEEWGSADISILNFIVPLVFGVLIVMGFLRAKVCRTALLACLVPFTFLCVFQLHRQYSYGLYKVISISSFIFFPLLANGAVGWITLRHSLRRTALIVVTTLGVVGLSMFEVAEDGFQRLRLACLDRFIDLPAVQLVARERPIEVTIDDTFDQLWAVYFLRDVPLLLRYPQSYLSQAQIFHVLARAKPGRGELFADVRSGLHDDAIWSNGAFSIVPKVKLQRSAVEILAVANPNGLEVHNGVRFAWLGGEPMMLRVDTSSAGEFVLRASRFVMGPSLPGVQKRRLEVEVEGERKEFLIDESTKEIPLRLAMGENEILLKCLDAPAVLVQPNGDRRHLLLGISGYSVRQRQEQR